MRGKQKFIIFPMSNSFKSTTLRKLFSVFKNSNKTNPNKVINVRFFFVDIVGCLAIDKTLSSAKCENLKTAAAKLQETSDTPRKPLDLNSVNGKENEVLDVVDLHKIAKLQEESNYIFQWFCTIL